MSSIINMSNWFSLFGLSYSSPNPRSLRRALLLEGDWRPLLPSVLFPVRLLSSQPRPLTLSIVVSSSLSRVSGSLFFHGSKQKWWCVPLFSGARTKQWQIENLSDLTLSPLRDCWRQIWVDLNPRFGDTGSVAAFYSPSFSCLPTS